MARLLIGSSNVYRFYEAGKFKSYNPDNMMRCTRLEVFKAKMDALEVDDKEIVISVIENFICDAVRDVVLIHQVASLDNNTRRIDRADSIANIARAHFITVCANTALGWELGKELGRQGIVCALCVKGGNRCHRNGRPRRPPPAG